MTIHNQARLFRINDAHQLICLKRMFFFTILMQSKLE